MIEVLTVRSRVMLTSSSLLKNEKKKKKRKEIQKVIGEEGDVKIKEKWFRKQSKKEDETCGKENENKGELRGW